LAAEARAAHGLATETRANNGLAAEARAANGPSAHVRAQGGSNLGTGYRVQGASNPAREQRVTPSVSYLPSGAPLYLTPPPSMMAWKPAGPFGPSPLPNPMQSGARAEAWTPRILSAPTSARLYAPEARSAVQV